MEAKINIRGIINSLEVGQSTEFSNERYDYVVSCRTRLQTTSLKRFTSKINKTSGTVTITRCDDKPQ